MQVDHIIVDGVSIVHDMDIDDTENYNAFLYSQYKENQTCITENTPHEEPLIPTRNHSDTWGYIVIPRRGTNQYIYTYQLQPIKNGALWGTDKVHISVLARMPNIRGLRIEWNPNKVPYDFLHFLKEEFNSCSQNPFTENRSITSLALAFDYYGKQFLDYSFTAKYARKAPQYKSITDDIKESIGFGSHKGNYFNIYNKAREQKIKDYDWLRIEHTYNKVSIQPEYLLTIQNPLVRLSVLSAYTDLDGNHNSTEKLLNRLILKGDSYEGALSCLKKTSRNYYGKKLRKLMAVSWWNPKPYLRSYYNHGLKDLLDFLGVEPPQRTTILRVRRKI